MKTDRRCWLSSGRNVLTLFALSLLLNSHKYEPFKTSPELWHSLTVPQTHERVNNPRKMWRAYLWPYIEAQSWPVANRDCLRCKHTLSMRHRPVGTFALCLQINVKTCDDDMPYSAFISSVNWKFMFVRASARNVFGVSVCSILQLHSVQEFQTCGRNGMIFLLCLWFTGCTIRWCWEFNDNTMFAKKNSHQLYRVFVWISNCLALRFFFKASSQRDHFMFMNLFTLWSVGVYVWLVCVYNCERFVWVGFVSSRHHFVHLKLSPIRSPTIQPPINPWP